MKKLVVLSLILLVLPLFLMAEDIILSRDNRNTNISIVSDRLMDRAEPSLTLECFLSKLTAETVKTEAGEFSLLSIPRYHTSSVIGAPRLPVMNQLIEVPMDATLSVKVVSCDETEYSLKDLGITLPLMPHQPSHPKDGTKVPFAYDRSSYAIDSYTKGNLVTISDIGMLRHLHLAMLQISPVVYNPVQGKIKVYNNIRLEIAMPEANMSRTFEVQKGFASPYFDWVKSSVLSADSLRAQADLTKYPVTYVIVSDRMFEADLESFIEWKKEKGFNVVVGYTDVIGKTTDAIKTYVHGLYNSVKPAPSFVLFVGDTAQVPSFAGTTGSHVTDLYYVTVTSGDNLPDMYTGRFSATNSAELLAQIEKTLEYEKYEMPDPSFLKDTVLIAGWDSSHAVEWGWPQINYAIENYYNKSFGYENVHVFLSAGSHQNESSIVSLVGNGTGYLNYTAHGSSTSWADPSFSISQINALANKGKYPMVVGNCCLTNKFEVGTCFGEAWLRAKGRGAIGYIGGSNSTYWDEDLWWGNGNYAIKHPNSSGAAPKKAETGRGAYDAMFTESFATGAAMIFSGNLAVEESSSPRKKYYWEVYHLMGDPSLMVYCGIPTAMNVTYKLGNNSVEVTAENGAYVAISSNGELLGADVVKANGKVVINLNAAISGAAKIVVTKQNRQPFFGNISVK